MESSPDRNPMFKRAECFKAILWIVSGAVTCAVIFGIAALMVWWRK